MDDAGKKRCLGKEGNNDCKEGSSAMADGRRIRNGSKAWTTLNRLFAYFSSSFIALFILMASVFDDPLIRCLKF